MTDKELEKIYNEAYKPVYWTAMQLLKNESDAEDIVQESFIAFIESYSDINDLSKVVALLKKIAANKCLNRIRLEKTDNMDEEFFDSVEAVAEDFLPDSIIESEDARRIIMDIINNSLSEDIRRTLILFYFDEMSTKEISQALGVPEGTVRRRLNFARNKIKKEVEKYEEDNKTKLFGMALPFLSRLFMKEAEQVPLKAMPAKLLSLSASAQASRAGAATKIAASAAKKGTGIIMKKVIIGSVAAVAAVGVVVGIIVSVLIKKTDAKPEKVNNVIEENNVVDNSGKDNDVNVLSVDSNGEAGVLGFAATGKLITSYGDYYLKETVGEFVEQFSSDDFKIIIFDADNNNYTVDDLETVVTSDWVGVNIEHGVTFVCEINTDEVDGLKLKDCRINNYSTSEGTTSVEINNITVKIGETTKDELISSFENYESKDETQFGYIRFNMSEYELNSYSYKLNDDNTVRFITVNDNPFI